MNKRVIVFIFALMLMAALDIVAQAPIVEARYVTELAKPDNQLIFYRPDSLLSINDFQGQPSAESDAAAITSSGFAFNAGMKTNKTGTTVQLQVYCTFNKKMSWMKPAGKTAYILQHEQHHFDISYISAMQFLKAVQAQEFDAKTLNQQLTALYNKATSELQSLQSAYDAETIHGINEQLQAAWSQKIKKLLAGIKK
jgi:hypothetical protein